MTARRSTGSFLGALEIRVKLWAALYLTIWVVFGEFLLVMVPLDPRLLTPLHVLLGVALVGVTYWNFHELRATRAPGRIKRVAQWTFWLAIVTAVLGVPLVAGVGTAWPLPVVGVSVFHAILFFHIVNAFAILTQTAATAIAYDMWEEHEFSQETRPGEVPAAPAPTRPVGPGARPGSP